MPDLAVPDLAVPDLVAMDANPVDSKSPFDTTPTDLLQPSPDGMVPRCKGVTCKDCTDDKWCLEYPYFQTKSSRLGDVWIPSPKHIVAAGMKKTWHFDGSTWTTKKTGGTQPGGIWGAAANDVFSTGSLGEILRFDGSTWSKMTHSVKLISLSDIWGTSAKDIYATGHGPLYGSGLIVHYDGAAWKQMTTPVTGVLGSIWGNSASDIFVAGLEGTPQVGVMLHYDGTKWSKMAIPTMGSLFRIWASGSSDVYAIGPSAQSSYQHKLIHYDGTSWSTVTLPAGSNPNDIWGFGPNDVYATGGSSPLHYDGKSWTKTTKLLPYVGIRGSSSSEFYGLGQQGIYRFDGTSWCCMCGDSLELDLLDVWAAGSNDITAVGYHYWSKLSVALRYDGTTWRPTFLAPGRLRAVWGSSASDIFAVGENAAKECAIYHFNGSKWSAMACPTPQPTYNALWDVWGTGPNSVFAVGHQRVLRYDGKQWKLMAMVPILGLSAVWGPSPSNLYVGNGDSKVLHYDGTKWTQMTITTAPGGLGISRIWGTSATDVWFVGNYVVRYDGKSFSPPVLGGGEAYQGIDGTSSSNVYVVSAKGKIVRWDGTKWTYLDSGTVTPLNGVTMAGAKEVVAVGKTVLRYKPLP